MKWILSTDRLPEYIEDTTISKDVIVFTTDGVVHVGWFEDGSWFNMSRIKIWTLQWMPLPDPPKE